MQEWLEADGLGGFAMGTASGIRSRRYHALLQVAATPPTGRVALVNGFDAWVETAEGTFAISSQLYTPDVRYPDGETRIESFTVRPWPTWVYKLSNNLHVQQEIFVPKGSPASVISWHLIFRKGSKTDVKLHVRPFLSGRDYHNTHHENPAFRFQPSQSDARVVWQPYAGLPSVAVISNGRYEHKPDWHRNFLYTEERARGLDAVEDLASPGVFQFDISKKEAVMIFAAEKIAEASLLDGSLLDDDSPLEMLEKLKHVEKKRRKRFPSRLRRSADEYLVRRGMGLSIVAGYPWFTDWGRDTFISMRGLYLATNRLEEAWRILLEWANAVSEGMLPNVFTDRGLEPEYNTIDASLWYIIAAYEFLQTAKARRFSVLKKEQDLLGQAVQAVLEGYEKGTRFQIHMDTDGLIAGGVDGVALTWMDACVKGRAVTPRIGKPVEIQALWLNALRIGAVYSKKWTSLFTQALESFRKKFWNDQRQMLYDVIDVNHQPGAVDGSFRPNQIFAVGGLPFTILEGVRARRVVDAVEEKLLTPLGLRSLAPGEPGYTPHYEGDPAARDSAYHQGTVWPWLIGPFVEAWVRVQGATPNVLKKAHEQFLKPFLKHLDEAGLGHISEIVDAEAPFTPRGCPFQAWSVGEVLRLQEKVLVKEPS